MLVNLIKPLRFKLQRYPYHDPNTDPSTSGRASGYVHQEGGTIRERKAAATGMKSSERH